MDEVDSSLAQIDPPPAEENQVSSNETNIFNDSGGEIEADSTIHAFNISNITVIENPKIKKSSQCEGSDSGVEVIENVDNTENGAYRRNLSTVSQDARSCDSSIISCYSNYDEAYNLLVRKNSTLLEDYRRHDDVTSENGSESSSLSGSNIRTNRRTSINNSKKKNTATDTRTKSSTRNNRSSCKPPVTPRTSTGPARIKSIDRLQAKSSPSTKSNQRTKNTPNNLDINKRLSPATVRSPSGSRTPTTTVADDGRWPSINSKPAPLMSRSLKGTIDCTKHKMTPLDTKTIEKYATLPRQKKGNDNNKETKKPASRENTLHRLAVTKQRDSTSKLINSSAYIPKCKIKTRIYHENSVQTALTNTDIENALAGITIKPKDPQDTETSDKDVQVDLMLADMETLHDRLGKLTEKYETLQKDYKLQTEKLKETEDKLREESIEKQGLKEELLNNSQRVMAILGGETEELNTGPNDSLLVLETKFQNVGQVVIQQEEEISKLNALCRTLQMELDKNMAVQKALVQQQQDLELESLELQDFMQAEKLTLQDALKESEAEVKRQNLIIQAKKNEIMTKQEEINRLTKQNEQKRQENVSLQARLGVLESKSRELLVHQGSSVSGAAVALSALIGRLDGLVEELVVAYSISDQELEDVIFHNEAYKNSSSSPESTPEKSKKIFIDKSPSPSKGSSFVSAVINAIKSAAQSPFALRDVSKDTLSTDHSSSNEMLDSETEPCLMMEHVLEDVVIPDGHSHNLVSSGHGSMMSSRLTQSESLKDISQNLLSRQMSEPASMSFYGSLNTSYTSDLISLSEFFPSISLVDQVIDVDNLVTRLLKVIRIIQMENEDCMNELQEQRDNLLEQVDKQKETNKVVVKQLKDWEILGARLKTEVKELMQQMSKKNTEMDNLKGELNKQREEVEKLNQDVCELSTALSKAEMQNKLKEEEVSKEIKKWEKTGEVPAPEILGRLITTQNEIPILKEQLNEKEKRLNELTQEFLVGKQVLSESLKEAVNESKKQYDAIDNALEVLHSIQTVVQQCGPLSKLQRDLEELNFQSASADFNANAALLQAVVNMEITPTINTTA
ncbi:coiled-coil domain-containing protein 18 [Diorhabda sublineata]|uniref:coiled-coil domain-containing protein 18 n=1 Tax=Diorhabda sublineata TaxID=1163346 RepID=UPI0024E04751|nr:coiled-coil domain-containing protein 18 [Diorhabda sublineata]